MFWSVLLRCKNVFFSIFHIRELHLWEILQMILHPTAPSLCLSKLSSSFSFQFVFSKLKASVLWQQVEVEVSGLGLPLCHCISSSEGSHRLLQVRLILVSVQEAKSILHRSDSLTSWQHFGSYTGMCHTYQSTPNHQMCLHTVSLWDLSGKTPQNTASVSKDCNQSDLCQPRLVLHELHEKLKLYDGD